MNKHSIKYLIAAAGMLVITNTAYSGIYSDDLSRCLVEKSTSEDQTTLTKWMFTALSLHPAVSSMSGVTESDRENSIKDMAKMFMDLMTVKCKEQATKAIKYEGALAIQQGFRVFGQVAGQSLFQHPQVAAGISGLDKYVDNELLEQEIGLGASRKDP